MDIAKARALKIGAIVRCPPDMGQPGYSGKVEHIDPTTSTRTDVEPFIWIVVRRPGAHASVWPSNRLGAR